jgi:hypothetical protein
MKQIKVHQKNKEVKNIQLDKIPRLKLTVIEKNSIKKLIESREWLMHTKSIRKLKGVSTLIIGVRCKDGIVVGADRKVTRGEESDLIDKVKIQNIEDKKSKLDSDIIFSATGFTGVWEDFLEEFKQIIDDGVSSKEIRSLKEVQHLAEQAIEKTFLYYAPTLGGDFIQFLFSGLRDIRTGDALLYTVSPMMPQIVPKDFIPPAYAERVTKKTILGHGAPYARTIANFLLPDAKLNDMGLNEIAPRVYACIKWICDGIDETVGGEPQIVGMRDNTSKVIRFENKDVLGKSTIFINNIKDKLQEFDFNS